MYAPLHIQHPHASPQAVRIHQAKQMGSTPGRSVSAPSSSPTPNTSTSGTIAQQSPVYRADTPQQDVPRWESQRGYTAIRNYSRSPSRSRGRVPIPEWVYEIDASRQRHRADALLQGGECASVTDTMGERADKSVLADVGTSFHGKRQAESLRRDSATPTHAELFFSEDGSLARPGQVYESRSDAYRNIQTQKPATGSAFSSLSPQIQKDNRKANDAKLRMDSYTTPAEPYQRDATTALTHPREEKKTTTLRRLSLRLPATPPLSEDMFDRITGDIDIGVENVFGEVTVMANMLSERDDSEAEVNECLERDGGVVEGKEHGKEEEEEDDFRWIRPAIRRC
jgi:hypothetical protein